MKRKNKIKEIWWCFWGTGVPRDKNYSLVNIVDFISCPSSSSRKTIWIFFCPSLLQLTDSSWLVGLSLWSIKTLALWSHWMKVCAKDRIEDIKIISKQEKRRKINTYVLIISRLLRYGCPKCWCQVLHPTHKQNNFVHPTVPNHM